MVALRHLVAPRSLITAQQTDCLWALFVPSRGAGCAFCQQTADPRWGARIRSLPPPVRVRPG